jgi:hypothetical protein
MVRWTARELAEIRLALFVLYRIRHIAAIKFSGLPASGAHNSADIPDIIGKRSIKIVSCRGHSYSGSRKNQGTILKV